MVLRAQRVRVTVAGAGTRRGVLHRLEHMDGTRVCVDGEWSTVALKPYDRDESRRPWRLMLVKWDRVCPMAAGRKEG